MLKISWLQSHGIQSYDMLNFEKVGNFYVPTCPIFAGPITYYVLMQYRDMQKNAVAISQIKMIVPPVL